MHHRRSAGQSGGCDIRKVQSLSVIGDCVMKTGENMENACINKACRELWQLLKEQGLQAKTIKFEVVNGELKQVDIFGEMKIEMV